MSYISEGQKLIEEHMEKMRALMEKYKDYKNPGMLDGEPWDDEERALTKAFSAGLKALRKKYPDWEAEVAEYKKQQVK